MKHSTNFPNMELCSNILLGTEMESNIKLMRIADVSKKTTLAKSTIWLKMSQGSFPKPTKLSAAINVWKESDIDLWIEERFTSNTSNLS
jgi:prophage regulatory protein